MTNIEGITDACFDYCERYGCRLCYAKSLGKTYLFVIGNDDNSTLTEI